MVGLSKLLLVFPLCNQDASRCFPPANVYLFFFLLFFLQVSWRLSNCRPMRRWRLSPPHLHLLIAQCLPRRATRSLHAHLTLICSPSMALCCTAGSATDLHPSALTTGQYGFIPHLAIFGDYVIASCQFSPHSTFSGLLETLIMFLYQLLFFFFSEEE